MHLLTPLGLLSFLLTPSLSSASATDPKPPEKLCAIHSTTTGSFYDLAPLKLIPRDEDDPKPKTTNESYHARGYDYHRNFTLNICAPVVEPLHDVDGINTSLWTNVSAYYKEADGQTISIGQLNEVPIFRGRKLLLNYTHGSPCPEVDEDGNPVLAHKKRTIDNDWEDEQRGHEINEEDGTSRYIDDLAASKVTRRKSTLLSFICDTAPNSATRPSISFLGSPDHCTYVFEVRSRWACAGATPQAEKGDLGPGGVFGVILGITIAVYLIGGVVYQRNVMHQRGWRQFPNYSVWAGLFGFFRDMSIILFSSCARRMPSFGRLFGGQRGFHRVGSDNSFGNASAHRGRTSEDANRLIDSLDEEWD